MQKETKDILKRSAIRSLWIVALVLLVYLLQGCGNPRLAPVEERDATGNGAELHSFYPPSEVDNSQQFYFVKPADTLYSIAFRYGLDYHTLAEVNNIDATYTIYPGQKLDLEKTRQIESRRVVSDSQVAKSDNANATPTGNRVIARRTPVQEVSRPTTTVSRPTTQKKSSSQAKQKQPKKSKETKATSAKTEIKKPVSNQSRTEQAKPVKKTRRKPAQAQSFTSKSVKYWMWPNMGRVIKRFSSKSNTRGIDIAGNMGEPVRAAAPGLVVYAGRGLRGYGNLIIVKHNNEFISAYAHNKRLLVKENEIIKAGQKIAEVGNTDSDIPKLHFEIRFKGKPVDPLRYLPKR
ncbi:peptidoglycan DD-metalloendopeptidase family protein [Kangiella shandongensis]|uniref:peptidoglycan DD-metalloendopeptidase family protein n=1 Tax=Kangiella shandongensis TaxID=2763258 RepID=UPI001CBB11FC|nr:peptidoglycan DD-metalloendopeptidase family protein [Kangiella shandongensis]